MSFEPPLAYLLRGRLNMIVWRLPIPERVASRLSALVYRNPPFPSELVVRVVSTLLADGVSCWIRGGWGVDALAHRQTRSHEDLDVLVDEGAIPRAVSLLAQLGFREHYRVDSDRALFSRVVMRDHPLAGRTVDIHPVDPKFMEENGATGMVRGTSVPCISLDYQIKHRASYTPRRVDREDLAVLNTLAHLFISAPVPSSSAAQDERSSKPSLGFPGVASCPHLPPGLTATARQLAGRVPTALIVPVPAAQALVDSSARVRGMPAHVTVMYPFLTTRELDREARRRLADAISALPAFDITVTSIGHFPNVVYLVPEPVGSLLSLTHAVMGIWPRLQPFEGEFDEIIPHLTISYGEEVPPGALERLPITSRVDQVWLMRRLGRRWVRNGRIPLGMAGVDRARISDVTAPPGPQ